MCYGSAAHILGHRLVPSTRRAAGLTTADVLGHLLSPTPYPAPSGGQVSAGLGAVAARRRWSGCQTHGPERLGPEAEIAPVEHISS